MFRALQYSFAPSDFLLLLAVVEEKQLDSLPYPNLRMVQDVAAGIDLENKVS